MPRKPTKATRIQVKIGEARARFSEFVRRALAGDEVIIAEAKRPILRLVPVTGGVPRKPGSAKGTIRMAADFDATPDEFSDYVA
ncbi:MAG TPA: type II toxin-antitoxin system prevent-host-death family antitoxin [Candidatus Binatia bacterium]